MKRGKNKWIAMICLAAMLLSFVPAPAFAEAENQVVDEITPVETEEKKSDDINLVFVPVDTAGDTSTDSTTTDVSSDTSAEQPVQETQVDTQQEAQPNPDPQPVSQPDPQPEPQPDPQPVSQPDPQPEPQPDPQPEPQPDPQPEPQPVSQPEPQVQQSEPQVQQPEPQVQQPEPQVQQPEPQSQPQQDSLPQETQTESAPAENTSAPENPAPSNMEAAGESGEQSVESTGTPVESAGEPVAEEQTRGEESAKSTDLPAEGQPEENITDPAPEGTEETGETMSRGASPEEPQTEEILQDVENTDGDEKTENPEEAMPASGEETKLADEQFVSQYKAYIEAYENYGIYADLSDISAESQAKVRQYVDEKAASATEPEAETEDSELTEEAIPASEGEAEDSKEESEENSELESGEEAENVTEETVEGEKSAETIELSEDELTEEEEADPASDDEAEENSKLESGEEADLVPEEEGMKALSGTRSLKAAPGMRTLSTSPSLLANNADGDDADGNPENTEEGQEGEETNPASGDGTVEDSDNEPKKTKDGLLIDRPEQSKAIITTVGTNEDRDNLEELSFSESYKIFFDEKTGIYRITFTIPENVVDENLTIDFTKALDELARYGGMTDSNVVQPGDTRVFEIFVETDSKHVYKYEEGSFVLTTPEQSELPEGVTPGETFDEQTIQKKTYYTELTYLFPPFRKALIEMGVSERDIDNKLVWSGDIDSFNRLYTEEQRKQMIVDYYNNLDHANYSDIYDVFDNSSQALSDAFGSATNTAGNANILILDDAIDTIDRYNHMYRDIMRVVYGEETVKEAVGNGGNPTEIGYTTEKTVYSIIDYDDGTLYDACIPAYKTGDVGLINFLARYYELPDDTLVFIGSDYNIYFGFKHKNGDTATESNSTEFKKTVISTQVEYSNSGWTESKNEDTRISTVGEYMKGEKIWEKADAYFKGLIGQGISANEATAMTKDMVKFMMAVNFDYEFAGNLYQNTRWGYNNTIKLERVDGELNLRKVEGTEAGVQTWERVPEAEETKAEGTPTEGTLTEGTAAEGTKAEEAKTITSSETTFQLWYYKDDNPSQKRYLTEQKDESGEVTYGFVDYNPESGITYTINTVGGELHIDYALLENIIYYLKEKLAPEGYELDTTVYIICDTPEKVEQAKELLAKDTEEGFLDTVKKTADGDIVAQYAGAIDSTEPLNIQISNVPLVDVEVEKEWNDGDNQDGIRPTSATFDLVVVGVDGEKNVIQTATIGEDGTWKHTFTKLPKYKDGKEVRYEVVEREIDGYTSKSVSSEDGYVFTFTNTHKPDVVEVRLEKKWDDADNQDGIRQAVTFNLLADGKVIDTVTLGADGKWDYEFTNLPKKSKGNLISYSIEETSALDGYTSSRVVSEDGYVYTFTNTHVPGVVNIRVEKLWEDDNNRDGIRPQAVEFDLVADGEVIRTVTLGEGGTWEYEFKGLPEKKNGEKITYEIREKASPTRTHPM